MRNLPEAQRENRQCLIDFCITNEYVQSNTFFLKPDIKKCTYQDTATDGFVAPWAPHRFAQLDIFLAPDALKNCVKDFESRPDIAVSIDHAGVIAKMQLKLKSIASPELSLVSREWLTIRKNAGCSFSQKIKVYPCPTVPRWSQQ